MKSIFFLFLCLFLVNDFAKCSKNLPTDCVICEERPCQCEELASEETDCKTSMKKLILLFLRKVNCKRGDPGWNQDCRYCRQACNRKHGTAKILARILKKACTTENEEENIRDIIIKLLDPKVCKKKPCSTHCDPQVQKVLRAILKKAAGCNCEDRPANCNLHPTGCNKDGYKYWFKTTKEALRKEIADVNVAEPEKISHNCVNQQKKYNKNKEVYHREFDHREKCTKCPKHNELICPRYIAGDCPIRNRDCTFSICADCDNCGILPSDKNSYVTLFFRGCKAVDSPFVRFTRNGHAFKEESERNVGLLVRTPFLQINDFREGDRSFTSTVFNPFVPKRRGVRRLKRIKNIRKKKKIFPKRKRRA